ncbi:hypothetical protein CDV55_100990 [Aspergillus turcosus]|uniref:FAD/NAD(P)-binding domain-containing protein n=1 Tax=Aspergillus turcosus TaxID=1245748 RepID=A0A229WV81_9EURO|nr:hypothetical protein CDV55_100990 [Aspergillus turcosus]RLL96106.1 hypothetical protein CFD26_101853 [Aspergillus turcosus]
MATMKGPIATERPFLNRNSVDKNGMITRVMTVEANKAHPHIRPTFEIEEHPIDEVRPIKVGVIGAGLSGITAGVLLPAKVPGLDLRIYDKNADVGGTWFENTYPGVRCDVLSHAYQSGFEPNTQWTEEFAQGREICEYWQRVARKYDVYKYLRLRQQVQKAEWLSEEAKWRITLKDLESGRVYEEKLDVVLSAIGLFNAWKLPDYEGVNDYQGDLFHSSDWNHNVDLKAKRVALIGNGAAGLQVLPSIQPVAAHVDHYARNRTWIADSLDGIGIRRLEAQPFSPDQLESFKDSEEYLRYRKSVEKFYFARCGALFKDTPENKEVRELWTKLMLQRVSNKPELADKIIPDFPPNCRRPTPGPGYLEALTKDNVSYIPSRIKRFTSKGIVTEDGIEREADVVICATGSNVDYAPPFSIIANGIDLKSAWKPDGLFGHPYNYLGVATPGFPNLFFIGGPHSTGHSGTVPNSVENVVTYIAKFLRKIRSQGIRTMQPSKAATDDFVEYCDRWYPRTVWSANLVLNYIRRDPRWEDWEYTYTNPSGNRFAYFGNGWRQRELDDEADLTPHLKKPETIDLRSYLEGWWDV